MQEVFLEDIDCSLHSSNAKRAAHNENLAMRAPACRRPPGIEIYRDGAISIFEVDGRNVHTRSYCEGLQCLMGLFISECSGYLPADVADSFVFYALCQSDSSGAHLLG